MEDLARGERIKALRMGRRLTQPAVVELLEQRAGAQVITLRGFQSWESGGGIRWENAKLLADVFEVDVEYLMTGREDQPGVADLGRMNGERTQLDQVLTNQADILDRLASIEDRLRLIDAAVVGLASADVAQARSTAKQGEGSEGQATRGHRH